MQKKIKNFELNIISNIKKIKYNYFVEKEFEAGIVLNGWEVKSLRAKKINIDNSYVSIINTEVYLLGAFFSTVLMVPHIAYNPLRMRKLLLNKKEISILTEYTKKKGYTIVVISIYWKFNLVKLRIGIAKGKKQYDKRNNIKIKEWNINKNRILNNFS